MATVDWSQLFKHRQAVSKQYPSIWSLPIAPRYSDVLLRTDIEPTALLEMGAGERGLNNKIAKQWPNCRYASFDIDPHGNHDFFRLEDITGTYDIVCMFEVIEHVPPQLALTMLNKCFEVLKPGGLLMITTPNIYYPPGFLRDATHITPWCYDELGGIAKLAGFEIKQLYRLYKEALLKQFIRRFCAYPLFRLLRIDFAKQIILVAKKPSA